MEIEVNPFQLSFRSQTSIKSITTSSNIDWLDLPPNPITGENVSLSIDTRSDVAPLKVFGTSQAEGTPAMISLESGHIPQIPISKVSGLQSQINTIVKTVTSGNSALTVTPNGTGDYTLTVNVGTSAGSVAAGNDARFPAAVTGIRKSSGSGATDVAAVAKVDFWDTTNFIASGASHAKGLVPDPGAIGGTAKFLREDATWATPAGTGTVTSVDLTMPAEFSVAGNPVTTSGTLAVTKATQTANKVFASATSGGVAQPTFRALVVADVPTGTSSSTVAIGNDTRFPASVTGLRKGAGAGSTDTAAVANVDYWDTDVFLASGAAHAIGLVPDPGASVGSTRYLREDATWQLFIPAAGSITNSMLATMVGKTIKGNQTAGSASPTDLSVSSARVLLGIDHITTFADTDVTATVDDTYLATSATLTAIRTVTLPLASTTNVGQTLTISDDFGGINGANQLKIAKQGSDTIQGSTTSLALESAKGSYVLVSDGVSKWSVQRKSPSVRIVSFIANTTYNTPNGVKSLIVEGVSGGAGGAGSASGAGLAAGGGGGGGAYGKTAINNPAASYAVGIGAGGAGGTTGANGSSGGSTTFGAVLNLVGGSGGTAMTNGSAALITANLGSGGTVTTADFGSSGGYGDNGIRLSGTIGQGGAGGSSSFGGRSGSSISGGYGGSLYGGGGSGSVSTGVNQVGGDGKQGIIIVTELY